MTLSIKNGGYTFLVRLDLIFPMSLWREFQWLQVLNDLSMKHLINIISNENKGKLSNLRETPYSSIYDMFEVQNINYQCLE